MPSERAPTRRQRVLALGVLCLAAFALRCMPAAQVFQPDGVHFYDSDSFYHMRRILMCVEHFPRVPIHDPFSNHPYGGVTMWPPLHDTVITAAILAIGGRSPSHEVIETVAALAPPVIGALTLIPVYFLGLRLFGRREALLAAGLMALQPAHVLYSAVGRPDQHVSEIALSAVFFACLVWLSCFDAEGTERSAWRRWLPRRLGAFAGAATVLVWMGALLFHAIGAATAGLMLLWRCRSGAAID